MTDCHEVLHLAITVLPLVFLSFGWSVKSVDPVRKKNSQCFFKLSISMVYITIIILQLVDMTTPDNFHVKRPGVCLLGIAQSHNFLKICMITTECLPHYWFHLKLEQLVHVWN